MRTPLPIDPFLPRVLAQLREGSSLVLSAEPGAGKTTRVPHALLEAGLAGDREVLVLQPRRLAARLAARRVADENGERIGDRVGYQVRFEEVAGPNTRLRFMTEGVLTRQLLSDPRLARAGVVVLDEFHERHLDGDLCLALLRRLQQQRPELKVVVMSATLDAGPIQRFLGGAPLLEVPGRRFEVAIEHLPQPDERHLDAQVASAVRRLVREGLDGDVLVFLPGAAEIRRAMEALEEFARSADLLVVPLHGDLPAEEQDRAVRPADRRKVILSTNVAETSVTIEGVVAVVDSGLARVAGHAAWSGMPTLKVARVAKASAIQRAGRAGRVRAGRCLRLYTRHDFETRPEHDLPEVRRVDLAEPALALHGAGVRDLAAFEWFEAPEKAALDSAERLLARLGATDPQGGLTPVGRRMLGLPVHPRQARLMLEAEARGRGAEGCVLAALLGEREIRRAARAHFGGPQGAMTSGPSDLLESLEAFQEAERVGFDARRLESYGIDAGAARAVDRVRRNLVRQLRPASSGRASPAGSSAQPGQQGLSLKPQASSLKPDPDEPLLLAILAGYPDRVARRRHDIPTRTELLLCGGGTAKLSEQSVVRDAPFLVAVDAEERTRSGSREVVVRVASRIEPEWLLDLFADRVRDASEVGWNAAGERVEAVSRLMYDDLVIEESRTGAADPERAAEVLAKAALARGLEAFVEPEALAEFRGRLQFAASLAGAEAGLPDGSDAELEGALRQLCVGCRSFADLRERSLLAELREGLSGQQRALLERLAPERLRLPGGRSVAVHYEPGKPPWLASRLQDFFGLAAGPAVGGGRVPVVLHLLAPNQRAVQVTTDLAGFWDRHYPAIRRELCRKYPRHSWPEDPRTAQPPPAGRRG